MRYLITLLVLSCSLGAQTTAAKSNKLVTPEPQAKSNRLVAPEPQMKDYKAWDAYNDAHTRWIVDQETGLASGSSGRFQLFFSPHARADVYLVDTATGRIWKPITINNAKDTNLKTTPELWVYQDRVDTEQEFDSWALTHTVAPSATATPAH